MFDSRAPANGTGRSDIEPCAREAWKALPDLINTLRNDVTPMVEWLESQVTGALEILSGKRCLLDTEIRIDVFEMPAQSVKNKSGKSYAIGKQHRYQRSASISRIASRKG